MFIHISGRAAARVALTLLSLCTAGHLSVSAQDTRSGRARGRVSSRRARTPTPAAGDARANAHVEEGNRRADEGDWAAALKEYQQAVAANPNNPEAHIHVGDAYMSLGKYAEGFAAYKEAVRVSPANAEAHHSLGAAYNEMAMYGDAFKPFVRAIGLDPRHAEAHYGIGYAYLGLENFKEAAIYLKRAVRLRNDYADAHLSLGLAYLGLGQLKAAEEQLKVLEGMDALSARELEKGLREAGAAVATARPEASEGGDERKPAPLPDAAPRQRAPARAAPEVARKAASDSYRPESGSEPVAPDAPRPKGSAESRAAEFSLWDRIKNSTDPADFAGYLKTYPRGEFAGLARIRLRVVEARGGAPAAPSAGQLSEATQPPRREQTETAATVAQPAPTQPAASRRGPTVEGTLELLKIAFANNFTYTATAPGQEEGVVKVTSEVVIEYVPLSFKSCRVEWRERKDTLSVALSDLDPLSVKVEPRSRLATTFSSPVWDVSVSTLDRTPAIRALKGDGSNAVKNQSDLVLQVNDKERAERLARLLQQGIILCKSGP